MPSIAAKNVALDVISSIGKSRKINKAKIAIKHGYSKQSARSGVPLMTKTYKETIEVYVNRLDKLRSKVLIELTQRDLSVERFATLSDTLDKLTKQSQLLQGKSTENIATIVNVVDYSKE